jgi:RecB family exonuclease
VIATAMGTHLSFSQLRNYQECPRAWYYAKVAQVEPERTPASLAFGSAVHAACAAVNEAAMYGEWVNAGNIFDRAWAPFVAAEAVPLALGDEDEAAALAEKGRALADAYRPPSGIVAVEQYVEIELAPGLPPLVGYIDVLRQTDDGLVVADIKTSSTRVLSDVEMLAAQLGLYGIAYPVVRSEAIVLFKGKAPSQTVQVVEPWPVRRLRTWASQIFDAMQAGIRFSRRSRNCRTCQFRDRCAAE